MWRLLLVALAGVELACGAALRAKKAATALSGDDGKVPKEDLIDMLTSFLDVEAGIAKEQATFKTLSTARAKSCALLTSDLKESIVEGKQTIENAKASMERAKDEVDSIEGSVEGITKQVKLVESEIAALQKQLDNLRKDRAASIARDNAYTKEVAVILDKAEERIEKVWARSKADEKPEDDTVSTLAEKKEEQAKAEAAELTGSDAEKTDETALELESAQSQEQLAKLDEGLISPFSFLQLDLDESEFNVQHESSRKIAGEGDSKEKAAEESKKELEDDKKKVDESKAAAREEFQDEELKIMEAIKEKRKQLEPLEAKIAERQPGLSDQLRKISESNRTIILTTRGIAADEKVIEMSAEKCKRLSEAKDFEGQQRPKAANEFLSVIAAARQLGKELNYELPSSVMPKKEAASFLQLSSDSGADTEPSEVNSATDGFDLKGMMQKASGELQQASGGEMLQQAGSEAAGGEATSSSAEGPVATDLKGMMQKASGELQQASGGEMLQQAGSEAAGSEMLQQAGSEAAGGEATSSSAEGVLLQSSESSMSSESSKATEDPLKDVKKMITNLIDALQQEQNEEKQKQTFCAEQEAKAAESKKKASGDLKTKEQQKRWAENAVYDLQAEINFMNEEMGRLQRAQTAGKGDLESEVKRIKDEAENHKKLNSIVDKSVEVLKNHCGKDPKGTCGSVVEGLDKTTAEVKKLDEYLAKYIVDFAKITEDQQVELGKTLKEQERGVAAANADYNKRKDEFAQLNADVATAKNAITLAGEAEKALDSSCGAEVHSLEDIVARRKEEIRQMKNAIAVLDGEAFR